MNRSWVQLLAVFMATWALFIPITEAKRQGSKGPQQKANQKNNWQTQNLKKPAAHLIGVPQSQRNTLKWISESDVAFTRRIMHPTSTTLETPKKGLYYVYCQVGFGGTDTNLRLSSEVITWNDSINDNVTLLVGSETIVGPPIGHNFWHTSLNQGGLANLNAGQKLYVHVSHPELVDYTEGKTFFGLVKVS
ncbi:lymphotoxin-beta isoform X2 [Mixophyes fleayi]|uniref:lymphotoxin-beta isoform X2 n=1 Tax=Mixophyes fleayi TaxID=3061075 RepID=UPI003F4D8DBB